MGSEMCIRDRYNWILETLEEMIGNLVEDVVVVVFLVDQFIGKNLC